MPATPTSTSLIRTDLEFKLYSKDRDFRAEGKPEPNSRSQTLIYHLHDKKWWIKVTFKGVVSSISYNI